MAERGRERVQRWQQMKTDGKFPYLIQGAEDLLWGKPEVIVEIILITTV